MLILGRNKVARFGTLEVYASNGFIRIKDTKLGTYNSIHPRDCLLRLKGISDLVGNSTDQVVYYDILTELQRFVEEVVEIVGQAREQGTYDDPSAVRERNRRLPKNFVMTGGQSLD